MSSIDEKIAALKAQLAAARRPRALTGAGVSAESGIPTFRGPGGLWKSFRPEDLATPQAFARDPKLVWEWYDWRRGLIARAKPNAGHAVLAGLQKANPEFWLITQNVDALHQKAGSKRVLELHGSIWRTSCTACPKHHQDLRVPILPLPPKCGDCGGLLRPGVVWFGEPLPEGTFDFALRLAENADLFLVIGTSGVVEPAASLARAAKAAGAFVAEINPEPSALTDSADLFIKGKSAEVLAQVV